MYTSLTTPFAHQKRIDKQSRDLEAFAFLMEMGTGKSKLVVDTAGHLHEEGDLDDVVIICPNGLQRNWRDQFAWHCGVEDYRIAIIESHMKAHERRDVASVCAAKDERMRVLAVNVEGIGRSDETYELIEEFMKGRRVLAAVDESQRIKSKKAAQTKAVLRLANRAAYRRIASGTATPNSPTDLYPQFAFLDPKILGFDNFTAFKAHYCELVSVDDPMLRGLAAKIGRNVNYIQLQARDINGRPLYKNLDQLAASIAPHMAHVLKKDCLDLPPKLYERRTIDLSLGQRRIYNEVRKSVLAEFVHDGRLYMLDSKIAISRLLRLAQIAGNHFPDDERKPVRIEPDPKKNPRMAALVAIHEDAGEVQGIVWCRHLAELDEIETYLGRKCARLDGGVKTEERFNRVKRFQAGDVQYLIGQEAIGIGFDAFAAQTVVYYTNDYSLEHRLQSEDRAHRQGLKHPVTYFDIEALDTVDGKIIDTLRAKREVSDMIAGDPITTWI